MKFYTVIGNQSQHLLVRASLYRDDAQAECHRLNKQNRHRVTEVDVADDAFESYLSACDEVEAATEKAVAAAAGAFLAGSRELFDVHPDLLYFWWGRELNNDMLYLSIHYKDGDTYLRVECSNIDVPHLFVFQKDRPDINDTEGNEAKGKWLVWGPEGGKWVEADEPTEKAILLRWAVVDFLTSFRKVDFDDLFGCGVLVYVNRNGRVVTEVCSE